jgi:hypothetical protein
MKTKDLFSSFAKMCDVNIEEIENAFVAFVNDFKLEGAK